MHPAARAAAQGKRLENVLFTQLDLTDFHETTEPVDRDVGEIEVLRNDDASNDDG